MSRCSDLLLDLRPTIGDFAKVAGPLHGLTKKDVALVWSPHCQTAFEKLKQLLTSASLLAFIVWDCAATDVATAEEESFRPCSSLVPRRSFPVLINCVGGKESLVHTVCACAKNLLK